MATISDIAKEAKVSKATVSRMINNSGYVGEKTRAKIEEAIKKLDYVPNAAAVSLSKRESKIIGVMVPKISNPFFGEVIEGISEVAYSNGYVVMLFDTSEDVEREMKTLMSLKQQNICGLILTPACDDISQNPEFYDVLNSLKTKLVFVDREVENLEASGVFCDNEEAAFNLVSSLISKGHEKIAIMAGTQSLKLGRDRLSGYLKAMKHFNKRIEDSLIFYADFNREKAMEETLKMLEKGDIPTAIFSCNNVMTEGIIQALIEKNKVEEFEISSYDELPWAKYVGLKIEYLNRNNVEMGRRAANIIVSNCLNKDKCVVKKEYIETQIIKNNGV